MIMLQIEHPVPSFDKWKEAFDSDPVGRQRSGVRRHRVIRPLDNPHIAMIELEFDTLDDAEALLSALQGVWKRVEGSIMTNPQTRLVEIIESVDY